MKVVAVKSSLASELRAPVEQLKVIAGRHRSPLLSLDVCGDEVLRLPIGSNQENTNIICDT